MHIVVISCISCVHVAAGAVYTDPGATALDNVDGNLTSSLSAFGTGAVSTAKPTGTTYFTVTYTVQVSEGTPPSDLVCLTLICFCMKP